ncbi:MAG: FliA/WhiG family RNA polymerase sigma factor [Dehalococcoidia bacterium]|nr:FliA/WhiG family RNA polymerase sigma factor [Dehalococcoidia bacterium]
MPSQADATAASIGSSPPDDQETALSQLVRDYMPLVRHVVNRILIGASSSSILQYEDMVSCGVQGLIEAYHSFDANKGAKFSTYALPRIRGSILDALRAAHPLPRSLQKFASDIEAATSALHNELGRGPSKAEIAERLGVPLPQFLNSLRHCNVRIVSLDNLADVAVNGNSERLCEMADEDPSIDPNRVVERSMVKTKLQEAVSNLPERERVIVQLYYIESKSLKSIGQALGISESRASQLRQRALRRLRAALMEDMPEAA